MRRTLIVTSSVLFLLVSCVPNRLEALAFNSAAIGPRQAGKLPSSLDDSGQQAANAAPGVMIVKLRSRHSASQARGGEALKAASGLNSSVCGDSSVEDIRPLLTGQSGGAKAGIFAAHGIYRTFVVKLSAGQDVESAIGRLEASGEVEYAEPNRLVKLGGVRPNDPQFASQWALLNWGDPID